MTDPSSEDLSPTSILFERMDPTPKTKGDRLRRWTWNLEEFFSQPSVLKFAEISVILVFFLIVIFPPLYLVFIVIRDWSQIYAVIFNDPIIGDAAWKQMLSAMKLSFQIAFIVMIIDLIIGLPMAYILARYNFPGKKIVDTLVDIPLAVPTSALGFSIYLFWGTSYGLNRLMGIEGGIFTSGPMLIIMAHVAFSYPYIVRNLKGIIEAADIGVEDAGRTLGAPSFTVFRTLTMPLVKEGIVAGSILAFTRSLGETGATLIVAGIYETAPITVVSWTKSLRFEATAFLSVILIVVSIILLIFMRFYTRRVGFPVQTVFPTFERKLSSKSVRVGRDFTTYLFFFFVVFLPTTFIVVYLFQWWDGNPYTGVYTEGAFYSVFKAPDNKWSTLWLSLLTSIEIAGITTLFNLLLGVPMAFILARRTDGKLRTILDALVDIPLVIPSSALGFAVFYLWGPRGLGVTTPGFFMIILVHISFTYPYMVRPMLANVLSINPMYEEASTTLGSNDFHRFRTVTMPLIKTGLFASAIMTFTRSMSETGATIVVMGIERTIPVMIIDFVESEALPAGAFAATILIVVSFLMLLLSRYLGGVEETQGED
ncbi:MAG: ABC transporter permease [Candidatus Kariarchaeaceae archaeon]